jgi:RNA polymerase sigma factor (sigma-70 family)
MRPRKKRPSGDLFDEHRIYVQVGVRSVEETVTSGRTQFTIEDENALQTDFSLRFFRPGNVVLAALLEDLFTRSVAGDRHAHAHVAAFLVEQYLPQPTFRGLSPQALRRGGVLVAHPDDDDATTVRKAVAALEAQVGTELSTDDNIEDEIMRTLVGTSCAEAGTLLPDAQAARRVLLTRILRLDRACYAEIRAPGPRPAPRSLTDLERRRRHYIRQEIERRLPRGRVRSELTTLQRLTALLIRDAHHVLVDQANRLTLSAMESQLALSDAERRAYEFFWLKRQQPYCPTDGVWFGGIIGDNPFLSGLLDMSPLVMAYLVKTEFFRAWPDHLLQAARHELRRQLRALVHAGSGYLDLVRDHERVRKAAKSQPRPDRKGDAASTPTLAAPEQDESEEERTEREAKEDREKEAHLSLLTPKQRRVAELRLQGMSIQKIANQLDISRQAVQNRLADIGPRVRRKVARTRRRS